MNRKVGRGAGGDAAPGEKMEGTRSVVEALRKTRGSLFGAFGIMMAAVVLAGVINYAFNIVMTRMLGKAGAFGEFYSLTSLFLIVSIGAGSLQTVVTKYVSEFTAGGEEEKIRMLVRAFSRWFIYVCALVMLVSAALAYPLAGALKLDSPLYVLILGSSIAVSIYLTLPYGILQGREEFVFLGCATISVAVLRLLAGAVLVLAGAAVYGALGAATIAGMAVALFIVLARKSFFAGEARPESEFNPLRAAKYLLPVAAAMFLVLFLTQIDVVLVKAIFSREKADIYSYGALAGKAIFFFPDGISVVMFPRVSALKAKGQSTKRVLALSLAAVSSIVCAISLFYYAFPRFTARFFAGEKGVPVAEMRGFLGLRLVVLFGIVMAVYALVKLLVFYHLALERTSFIWVLLGASVAQILGVTLLCRELIDVLLVMLAVGACLLLTNLVFAFRGERGRSAQDP